MKKWHRFISYLIVIVIGVVIGFLILSVVLPKQEGLLEHGQKVEKQDAKEEIQLVSLGDSLTEGIGDTTEQGGYVPIVSSELKNYFSIKINAENFGKSGDRSDQILKRLKENEEQQKALEKADIVILTVGANDLMKTVRNELFNNLTLETFKNPGKEYEKNLLNLFTEIRKYAPQSPIYVFGIYNPFYVYFTQMTALQDIVNYWDDISEKTVSNEKNCFFVPINDLLSTGTQNSGTLDSKTTDSTTGESSEFGQLVKGKNSTSSSTSNNENKTSDTSSEEISGNDLIFDEDNFHPNSLGYQKMATALKEKLIQTQGLWLKEDSDSD